MTQSFSFRSYAKINLFLHITGRYGNGYHKLQTLMQFIDLYDRITFKKRNDHQINIQSNQLISELKDNLIYKAIEKLQPIAKEKNIQTTGFDIYIDKKIPMGAGLGGGSSNAATTLLALNKLWQLNLSKEELILLGKELGADVPIFIFGKTAWAEGIGEKLTPFLQDEPYLLLIKPNIHISTETLFQNKHLKRNYPELKLNDYSFETTENAFEPVVKLLYPKLAEIIDQLKREAPIRLTGTGSCFYMICKDFDQQKKLQKKFANTLDIIPTKALNYAAVADDLSSE